MLFDDVKKGEEQSACAVGRVGSAWIADDLEGLPPVALEEAEGLVVERKEAVVAADDHDQVAADITSLNLLQMLRIVYGGVPPEKVLAGSNASDS